MAKPELKDLTEEEIEKIQNDHYQDYRTAERENRKEALATGSDGLENTDASSDADND